MPLAFEGKVSRRLSQIKSVTPRDAPARGTEPCAIRALQSTPAPVLGAETICFLLPT